MGTVARSRISSFHRAVVASMLAAGLSVGCGLSEVLDDHDLGSGGGGSVLDGEALDILRELFPKLSESELLEIEASLDFEAILALEAELEAARDAALEFSEGLFQSAGERVEQREADLADHNDGFPAGVEALGSVCLYDAENARGRVELSGVFDGKTSVLLEQSQVSLSIDGQATPFSLSCLQSGQTVDVVFLVDITGSMSNVISSVRDSVVSFVDALEASGIEGTVSVVSFQDTVGVNTTFQEPAPENDYERSPFFEPVALSNAAGVEDLRNFVNRLEANRGADASENLAGAVDFARNNVIGYTANGAANVIGDGVEDPAGTEPFPKLESERQIFVALTDITFHGDEHTDENSSLLEPFDPRDAGEILTSLQRTSTTVHVSDPSWVDSSLDATGGDVDADYWAIHTGGLGEDRVLGYSLVDLELVVVAEGTGLFDIALDGILSSTCSLEFEAALSAGSEVSLSLDLGTDKQFSVELEVERY